MKVSSGRFRRVAIVTMVLSSILVGGYFAFRAFSDRPAERHQKLQSRAVAEMARGNHEAARLLLSTLASEGGASNVDRVNLAVCLDATGRGEDAEVLLEAVVAASPGYAPARSRLASILYERGETLRALEHATAALEKVPDDPTARLIAGLAAFDLGRDVLARVHLRAVGAGDPGRTEALLRLVALGGPDAGRNRREADRRIAADLRRRPDSITARTFRARSLALAGNGAEALAAALAVLADRPDHVACLEIAIRQLPASERGSVDRLLAAAEPGTGAALTEALRAVWLARNGRPEDALAAIDALPAAVRDRPGVCVEEVRLLARSGHLVRAVDALSKRAGRPATEAIVTAIERASGSPERTEASVRLLALLLAGPRREPATLAFQARVLMVLGRIDEAERLLDRPDVSTAEDPAVLQANLNRLVLRGRVDEALRRAADLEDSLDQTGILRLAGIAVRTRRPRAALRLLDRIEADPPPVTAILTRASALLLLDRADAAEALLRDATTPRLILLHAETLFRTDRREEAVRRASRAEADGAIAASRALRAWWREAAADREGAAALVLDDSLPADVRRRAVLGLAEKCDRNGHSDARLFWLRRARGTLPAHPDILGRLALEEQRRGLKRPETLELAAAVRSRAAGDPNSRPLLLARATYDLVEGNVPEARSACTTALSRAPFDADARRLAALVALREGRRDEALRHLRTLVALRPGDRSARGLLQAVDFRSTEGASAELRPNAPRAVLVAILTRGVESGDLDRAKAALRALGLERDARFLTHDAALRTALAARRFDRAEEAARAMVKLRPGSPAAHYRLGLVLVGAKRTDAAIDEFREASRLAPEWTAPAAAFVRALLSSGRRETAREWLEARLKEHPNDALAYALLSEVRAAGGDLSGAIAFARRAVEIGGADAVARPALVRSLLTGRSAAEAWSAARKFVEGEAEPSSRDLSLAGQAALAADRPDEAAALFSRSLDRVSSRTGLAEIHARRGETSVALVHASAAAKMSPGDPAVVFLNAALLDSAGKHAAAIAGYERVLSLSEGHPLAALNLARHLARSGKDLDRARKLAAIAMAALPNEPEAIAVRDLVREKSATGPSSEDD